MFGELKDLNESLRVGELPITVNYNNKTIRDEFNYLFDSSNNYLTQSLYAPKGYVKSHWGDFVNLRVKNLTVENLNDVLTGKNNNINNGKRHDDLDYRFSWDYKKDWIPKQLIDYAHDTDLIVSRASKDNPISIGGMKYSVPISLRSELNALESVVDNLAKNITIKEYNEEIYDEKSETWSDSSLYDGYENNELVYSSSMPTDDFKSRLDSFEKRLEVIEKYLFEQKDNN